MQVQATGRDRQVGIALTIGIVVLTLTTSVIHYTLGGLTTLMGLMFFGNAAAYAVLAVAYFAPIRIAETLRPLTRLALLGVTVATIGGWIAFGARYDMAYLSKAIEVAMVALLVADGYRDRASYRRLLDRVLRFRVRRAPAAA